MHNLHVACEKIAVAPVLKSNAYGHGLVNVAQIMEQEKVPFLIVESYYEALILRKMAYNYRLYMDGKKTADACRAQFQRFFGFLDEVREIAKVMA